MATQPLSRLTLDLGRFRVSDVLVDGRPAKYTHRQHKLRVTPARPIPDGTAFRVDVRYVERTDVALIGSLLPDLTITANVTMRVER